MRHRPQAASIRSWIPALGVRRGWNRARGVHRDRLPALRSPLVLGRGVPPVLVRASDVRWYWDPASVHWFGPGHSDPGAARAAHPGFAGTVAGVGAAEVERRSLSQAQMEEIVRTEIADRETAATGYERAGQLQHAERLRAEAKVLRSHLDHDLSRVHRRSPTIGLERPSPDRRVTPALLPGSGATLGLVPGSLGPGTVLLRCRPGGSARTAAPGGRCRPGRRRGRRRGRRGAGASPRRWWCGWCRGRWWPSWVGGPGDGVGEVEEGVVAVGVELPGDGCPGCWGVGGGGAPGGGDLEEPGWVELADGAVEGGGVAVVVGVEPAQGEAASVGQVEVGVAPPLVGARPGR